MSKILLDENIPISLMKYLKKAGHDIEHINSRCKGKTDKEVLDYALKFKRIILTIDSDFSKFKKIKHYGIIKISAKLLYPEKVVLELLELFKADGLEDVYIQVDIDKAFKEVKKYGKKRKSFLKNLYRTDLNLKSLN